MLSGIEKLRQDALAIWQAGVDAVKPSQLFRNKVFLDGTHLCVEDVAIDLSAIDRLVVVGAGKASASMAIALNQVILDKLPDSLRGLPVSGWINAPADTFTPQQAAELAQIQLHIARPAGLNWPTEAAVLGTKQILQRVRQATQRDSVICLLSGGGSALLVAPRAGVTLADKQAVAREIASAGGNIVQLNTVRRALSEVKGGGLARACGARQMLTLILSDVLGDPLEIIASGPTLEHASCSAQPAWEVLEHLGLRNSNSLANVVRYLEQQIAAERNAASGKNISASESPSSHCHVQHVILGNNADAIDAAGGKAVELGYRYVMQGANHSEGDVHQVAQSAVAAIEQLTSQGPQNQDLVDCWISGGEPTVTLPTVGAGKGGRNQQLALAVLQELQSRGEPSSKLTRRPMVFVSGGTDGEDGPTDAAGAWIDNQSNVRAAAMGLEAEDFLRRADAYHFFERVGGLLRTGPTGTNVCDLRVALVGR